MRYAIKHIPTGKFPHEDEGGSYLVEESDPFVTWGNKKEAEKQLESMDSEFYDCNEIKEVSYPKNEFEVVKI